MAIKELRDKLFYNKTVKEVYQGRWVWYHTILGIELFIIIVLLTGILVVLGVKL